MDTVIVASSQFYSHYPKRIPRGTVNAEAVLIRLDSEWDNLTVRIHWLNVESGLEKVVLLERDQPNTIPWEVLTDLGELHMGLDGMDGGTVVKPTVWLTYGYVVDGVDPESGSDPHPPTPSWEQQMVEQATQANQAAQAAQKAAEEAAESVASVGPYADEAKKSAEAAKASQNAAAISANQASTAAQTAQEAAGSIGDAVKRAEDAATAAGTAQQAAEAAQGAAARSAETAQGAATTANQAAQESNSAATKAGQYLTSVESAAQAAASARDQATTAATTAKGAAQSAASARDQATTAATTAQDHATAASTAKDAAEQAAATAGSAQSGAAQSAQTAASSASAAQAAQQAAEAAAAVLPKPTSEDAGKVPMVNPEGTGYVFGEAGGGKIDDTTLGRDTTWSSRMIVDSLAPSFETSGPVITCNPVSGYPLSVVSQIVPVQDGDGAPGPDNVRPVSGWDGANIWKSGENIVDQSLAKNGSIGAEGGKLAINESASYGLYLSCDVNGDIHSLTFLGEYEGGVAGRWKICFTDNDNKLVPFTYTYNYPAVGASTTFLDASGNSSKRLAVISNFSGASKMWVCATDGRTTPPIITIVAGAVPDVAYSIYAGESISVNFGQKVYGGQLNWATGELTVEWGIHTFSEWDTYGPDWQASDNSVGCVIQITSPDRAPILTAQDIPEILCPVLRTVSYSVAFNKSDDTPLVSGVAGATAKQIVVRMPKSIAQTATDIKNWLISNKVSIVYRLKTPTTVQLMQQEILALTGTNTLYTDTGDITVSGRSDPNEVIKGLEDRIAALQGGGGGIMNAQQVLCSRALAATCTTFSDAQALAMPDILPTWAELLERGEKIKQGVSLMKDGQCYRAMQDVTPIESKPPGADGMLAVYRPIDKEHAGTLEDPIPWVSGMDCYNGKYYSHEEQTYLCKQDMTPCVWAPGTEGVWQWEVVS